MFWLRDMKNIFFITHAYFEVCLCFQVKAILVNVFAGIVNCENMANGIIKAYKEAHIDCPMVIRLEGRLNGILSYFTELWSLGCL